MRQQTFGWIHMTKHFSIYTLSDLGVLSNLIGSLSLANEHYSPPTEWIMRKPNKNKMVGVNSRFARSIKSIFNGFLLKMLLRSLPVYILKQLFFSISVNSGWIFTSPLRGHYSPRFQRIIVNYQFMIRHSTWPTCCTWGLDKKRVVAFPVQSPSTLVCNIWQSVIRWPHTGVRKLLRKLRHRVSRLYTVAVLRKWILFSLIRSSNY